MDTHTQDPDTEILTITTSPSTPTGTYVITLHITGSLNGPEADATFTLYVTRAVGGVLLPTNTLAVLVPYLAVISVVAVVSTVYFVKHER